MTKKDAEGERERLREKRDREREGGGKGDYPITIKSKIFFRDIEGHSLPKTGFIVDIRLRRNIYIRANCIKSKRTQTGEVNLYKIKIIIDMALLFECRFFRDEWRFL